MSSGNNDNSAGSGAALVLAFIAVMAMMFMALLAFITFVMTIMALFAWNKPRRIGKLTIQPEDARGFVHRGLAGAVLLPAFLVFVNVFFNVTINWDSLPFMFAAGYVGGSLGLEMLFADMDDGGANVDPAPMPPQQEIAPPARAVFLPRQTEPFRFASWDDEEERS